MPSKPFSSDTFDRMVAYYRQHPGDKRGAARTFGLDYRVAKRAWEGPPWQLWKYPVIKTLLAEEHVKTTEALHNEEEQRARELRNQAEKARKLADEAEKFEENVMAVARANVLTMHANMHKLTRGLGRVHAHPPAVHCQPPLPHYRSRDTGPARQATT
jgi:hypothetical protein